ncbi:TLC domain-containing protein 3A [Hyperolius riggenbachi]|uniref:TLC domain-containing protein 3A n=1 Tax=Hyperolius riggenbachi TaxID=752182 RepID=UPI0035A266C8
MLHVLAAGSLFFPGLYLLSSRYVRRALPTWSDAERSRFSARIVSAVQGILASASGVAVVTSCTDVKYDRHWLATGYVWFLMPYMVYDIFIMFLSQWYKCREDTSNGKNHFSTAINNLLRKDILMLAHHTVILTIIAPLGLFVRGDVGDFFVGCLFLAEMSTPFVSFGKILMQMNLQNSLLQKVNGIFVLITFFVCRILLFPFMYGVYGRTVGMPLYKVPFNIPLLCNLVNASILAPQLYWFWLICRKAVRLYSTSDSSKDK